MDTVIVFDAEAIQRMNEWAIQNNMNRILDNEIIENLDPDGLNLQGYKFEHNHRKGYKVDPHWRLLVLLKVKEKELPVNGFVDISFELYDKYARPIFINRFR